MKRLAITLLAVALAAAACTRFVNLAPPPDGATSDGKFVPDGFIDPVDASLSDGGNGPLPDAAPADASLVD